MSFTGGPRYMYAHYLDALVISRKLGNPQFFITFTCNVKWLEIKRFIGQYPELTSSDEADAVCRVFEQKIQSLITFLKEERTFRNVTGEDVDRFILAELLDSQIDPDGYKVVSEMMMHGPCGAANLKAPCLLANHRLKQEAVVQILSVNLENMHRITFRDRDRLESVVDLHGKKNTTLTEWFAYNAANEMGRHLTYLEFPSDFVWYAYNPSRLWSKYWKVMSHDIPKRVSETMRIPNYHLNDDSLQGYTLYEIEVILKNCGKSLQNFGLPLPPEDLVARLSNRLLMEEINYNRAALMQEKNDSVPRLNRNWENIPLETIISTLRSEGKLYWQSTTKNTRLGKLLVDTNLIIWDEAPMNDRCCFKALDRSLRDILNAPSSLFGGKSILLGGDFRQTLSVKKGASKMEVISSCISESELWPSFKIFTSKENMRLARPDIRLEERSLINSFASWLLDIGDEKIGKPAEEEPENTS
ncbi:DNA helicase [Tanacetum coccineum]